MNQEQGLLKRTKPSIDLFRTPLLVLAIWHSALGICSAPTINYIYPAGAQQGTTTTLTVGGKLDDWPLDAAPTANARTSHVASRHFSASLSLNISLTGPPW